MDRIATPTKRGSDGMSVSPSMAHFHRPCKVYPNSSGQQSPYLQLSVCGPSIRVVTFN